MIVLVYSRPLTSKLAETLSCFNRDLTACPSRSNTSEESPLTCPKGLIDFWLVVLFKPLYSMTSSFEWQLIRLHNSMGICLDTGNLHKVPIRDRFTRLPINMYTWCHKTLTLLIIRCYREQRPYCHNNDEAFGQASDVSDEEANICSGCFCFRLVSVLPSPSADTQFAFGILKFLSKLKFLKYTQNL